MPITFGSGQASGAPLLITATDLAGAQVLHTAVAGTATPNIVGLFGYNTSEAPVIASISLYDVGAVLIRTFTKAIPGKAMCFPLLGEGQEADLVLNGTTVIKAHADVASVLSLAARVDDQA